MTILVLVDSPAAVTAARREYPHAHIACDNPMLAHAEAGVENIDRLIPQSLAISIGQNALALTSQIEEILSQDNITSHFGLPSGKLGLMGPTSRLISSLLYRGAILARAVAMYAPETIVLRLVDLPRCEPTQPLILPRFANPALPLAELGFFAAPKVDIRAVPVALPASVNDTVLREWARRIALVPAASLAYELASRARMLRRGGTRIVVGQENEALRETLPWLWLKGLAVRRVGPVIVRPRRAVVGFGEPIEADPLVASALDATLMGLIAKTRQFDEMQRRALARLIVMHLSAGLRHLADRLPDQKRRIDVLFPDGNGVLLTNGLFGPAGMLVHRLCEAKRVDVYEFEHGVTAGLAALTDAKLEYGGPPPAKALFVCSRRAADAFNAGGVGPALAVGLPDQVRRVLRKPLQRRLARRALRVGRETVVMHVSTLPYSGNHRPGLGAPTETTIFTLDRTLIERVYPSVPHRVVFKQYPTQRFPFEPSYERLFRIAPNLLFRKDEDFRYIRAAADVIVTMTPTSTLGWCVGADVPLIWLDSRIINPLSSGELRDAFVKSFLFVDLDTPDWSERLASLLSRPLKDIREDWMQRRAAREEFYQDSIIGPAGHTGRRAAAAIIANLCNSSPAFAGVQRHSAQPPISGAVSTEQ